MTNDAIVGKGMNSGITRVILHNYKSIALGNVALGPLNFLVGPNGSGKSNFIDAMRFCRDALRTPLDQVSRSATPICTTYFTIHRAIRTASKCVSSFV